MAGTNPLVQQGLLNRVRTHIVVANYPALSITAPYMSKAMAVVTFEGPGVDQPETGTGIVNSPKPYVMGQIVVSLVRSQSLAAAWLAQWQTASILGTVTAYGDSSTLPPIQLLNSSLIEIDPGAFDGADPAFKITIKGVYNTNAQLWATTG